MSVKNSVLQSAALNWVASYVTPRSIGEHFGSTAMEIATEMLWRRLRQGGDLSALVSDHLVNRGSTVIDVGASWGLFTHHLARRVGTAGMVYAYEPHPANAIVLRKLADRRSNVLFRPVAVSDGAGVAEMQVPHYRNRVVTAQSSLAHGFNEQPDVRVERVKVPTVRLDDEFDLSKRIDFVKIDVEGHEISVLRGATALLRRWLPPILIEIEQRHLTVPIDAVFRELQDIGYHLYYLDDTALRPIAQFDAERDQQSMVTDQFQSFGMPKGYVYNFCAVPEPAALEAFGVTS